MIPRNCLSTVLDRLVEQGGYGAFRGSSHSSWGLHVLHISPQGVAHYAPGATLDHPVHALIGFDGVVWDREMADAPPVPIRGIVVGSLILAVGVLGWGLKRMIWRK